jgi:hypothetical protein
MILVGVHSAYRRCALDMCSAIVVCYARVDQEGRTLLHELFATAGDIRVCDRELHITMAPLSSPHRTHAAQAFCRMLNQTATIFPGSRLRIGFAVRPPPRIGLAFPGSPVERSTATAVAPVPVRQLTLHDGNMTLVRAGTMQPR